MIMKDNPRMVANKLWNKKGTGYLCLPRLRSQNIKFYINIKYQNTSSVLSQLPTLGYNMVLDNGGFDSPDQKNI